MRYETLCAAGQYVDGDSGELTSAGLFETRPLNVHALCGPIAIDGAKKGMTLEVQINRIIPATRGWNIGGGRRDDAIGQLWQQLGVDDVDHHMVIWTLDPDTGTGVNPLGHTVRLAPFMGVMGMPPDEDGDHSTAPPRTCGGNLDCKMLVEGSTLYLPIPVDGGLFSVGDGHAAQGDGEVSGTAIECPMAQVDLTFRLHPDMHLTTPRAHTPEGWITLGVHEDLDEATLIALNDMLDLMMAQYNIDRKTALSLASVVVDMRITQIVNGTKGVQAVLPDGAITGPATQQAV